MSKVLLLDQNYQPVKTITVRRACVLILMGEAEPVSDDLVTEFRSQYVTIPIPAVLRLERLVKFASTTVPPWSKSGVLARDHHVCQFVTKTKQGRMVHCTEKATTIDHLRPKSDGGQNSWVNTVAACAPHNSFKGSRTLDELGWRLRSQPYAPVRSVHQLDPDLVPASWRPYLMAS